MTPFVDRRLELAAADGALKDQAERAVRGRRLVVRPPVHPQRAGQADERLRLGVTASGPFAEVLPDHHFLLGDRRRRRPAAADQERGRDRQGERALSHPPASDEAACHGGIVA
jgi:hypothetical protein